MRMPRPTPNHSARHRPARKRSSWGPVLATAAATLAVFGVLAFVLHQSPAPSESAARTTAAQTSAATPVAATSVTHAPEKMSLAQAPVASRQVAKVKDADPQIGTVATVRVAAKPAAPNNNGPLTAADRAKLVREQIAAGEFGPALQTAKSATDAGRADAAAQDDRRCPGRRTAICRQPTWRSAAFPSPKAATRRGPQNSSRQSAAGGAAQAAHARQPDQKHDGRPGRMAGRRRPAQAAHLLAPRNRSRSERPACVGLTHQENGNVLSSLGHRAREADLNTDLRADKLAAARLADAARKRGLEATGRGADHSRNDAAPGRAFANPLRLRLSRTSTTS